MAPVATHKGGAFYDWYVGIYGYGPPDSVDDQSCRYIAWQSGWSKVIASLIPYGTIGNCDMWLAGGIGSAILPPAPPPAPAPAPPPPSLAGTGGSLTAPSAPAPLETAPVSSQPAPVATVAGANYPTQYGDRYTSEQIDIVRTLLAQAIKYTKLRIVYEALVYSVVGESNVSAQVGSGGPLQATCNLSAYNDGRDWAGQADAWLNGGECFARGGISYANEYNTAWQIAGATEENAVWGSSKGDSYERSGYTTAMLTAEAENTVAYFLPGLGTTGAPAAPTTAPKPVNINTAGISTAFDQYNWAGDFENLWKYVVGGADEAANMADKYKNDRVNQLTVIGWS